MATNNDRQGAERINPYDGIRPKGEQVEEMFDSIAPAYDFMNNAMSFGLHRRWRARALEAAADTPLMKSGRRQNIIDLATGTGDVAFDLAERFPDATVTGVDLSAGMLAKAREKRMKLPAGTASRIAFEQGDCLDLKFADNSFQLATIAYGVRNFENLRQGLAEIHRVLAPGGACVIIELSRPSNPLTRTAYDLYSRLLIPVAGRLASGDNRAYRYLPESIKAAPQRDNMTALLLEAGFSYASFKSLTMGVVCIYTAIK